MKIYLAGPLFTVAERDFNARLAATLRHAKHEVFVPQEMEQRAKTAREVFEGDVAAIDGSDVVLANMDGPDPDSGTCWECGYAYARRKTIMLFRTDFRSAEDLGMAPFNLMLSASAKACLDLAKNADAPADFATVATRIIDALAALNGSADD
jgi:nucleoside 2-deoxyribosyltransferase